MYMNIYTLCVYTDYVCVCVCVCVRVCVCVVHTGNKEAWTTTYLITFHQCEPHKVPYKCERGGGGRRGRMRVGVCV